MNFMSKLSYSFFASFLVSAFYVKPLYSNKVKSKYLQVSTQSQPLSDKATNFAIINSEDLGELQSSKLSICSSIYINFFRCQAAFYTLRRNNGQTLWFSLYISNQDTKQELYNMGFKYFGGSARSNTGGKLRVRTHAWSHACLHRCGCGVRSCHCGHQRDSHPQHDY